MFVRIKPVFFIALLGLSACGDNRDVPVELSYNGVEAGVSVPAPAILLASRMIDFEDLALKVRVDQVDQNLVRQGDSYIVQAIVPPGQAVPINIEWSTIFQGTMLPLAVLNFTLPATNSNLSQEISSSDYSTEIFDFDEDGVSNLDELNSGTSPESPDGHWRQAFTLLRGRYSAAGRI